MILGVWVSDKLRVPFEREFAIFLQRIAARRDQGYAAYHSPPPGRNFRSRLERELRAYKRTGNREHLINIAVYAFCETVCQEREEAHFDPTAGSVTREEFG